MPGPHHAEIWAVLAVMALPVVAAALPGIFARPSTRGRTRGAATDAFRTNAGGNGFLATLAGAVAGNVGVGSFLAIFVLASESAVIGASIVSAYSLGLVGCAVLAPRIRARCRSWGAVGLVDILVASGGEGAARLPIWLPVAFVFVLRSAVQVGALGLIAADAFGLGTEEAIVMAALLLGGYLVVGGYRAAVSTDIVQAIVLLAGVGLAAWGLDGVAASSTPFLALGPHKPVLLVGIWLFLPWSAILAVDNWQRIALARSDRTAVTAYCIAAVVCGGVFATIAAAGIHAMEGTAMRAAFTMLMPDGYEWIAAAMLVACIMSSVDTFVMPLAVSVGKDATLRQMRGAIIGLLGATALCAIALGDIVSTVITAFNGLAVFVPAALGALFGPLRPAVAAPASLNAGLVAALGAMTINADAAALIGGAVALGVYLACLRFAPTDRAVHPGLGERARATRPPV